MGNPEFPGSAGRQPSLLSKSGDTFANTPVMVSHRDVMKNV
jgi:hypothetical protein